MVSPKSMQLFSRENWTDFVKTTHDTQAVVGAQFANGTDDNCRTVSQWDGSGQDNLHESSCGDYWSYQFNKTRRSGDGYRENEVDLFVPQKPGFGSSSSNCGPSDEFCEDWAEALLGVFYCSTCVHDVRYLKDTYTATPCCNDDFQEALVKRLCAKANAGKLKGVRTIHGYKWSVDPIDGRWSPAEKDGLRIQRIT
jgi:hypothetical protein